MVKLIFSICIILLLFVPISGTCVSANDETTESSSIIRVKDDLLTVKVKDIPLNKVLREVAEELSIRIFSLIPGEEPVVADFSRLPVEEGLRRLLRDFNYAFTYGPEGTNNGEAQISKVFILARKDAPTGLPETSTPGFAGETSLEILRNALKDEDPFIREDAVDALGVLKDEGNIELLKGVLLTDEDEYVRKSATDALGMIRSEKAIDSLKEALKDKSIDVRVRAVEELGLIKSEDAIDALVVASQDEDGEVREIAIDALGWIGGDRATKAHEKALAEEEEKRTAGVAEIEKMIKNKIDQGNDEPIQE